MLNHDGTGYGNGWGYISLHGDTARMCLANLNQQLDVRGYGRGDDEVEYGYNGKPEKFYGSGTFWLNPKDVIRYPSGRRQLDTGYGSDADIADDLHKGGSYYGSRL